MIHTNKLAHRKDVHIFFEKIVALRMQAHADYIIASRLNITVGAVRATLKKAKKWGKEFPPVNNIKEVLIEPVKPYSEYVQPDLSHLEVKRSKPLGGEEQETKQVTKNFHFTKAFDYLF